MELAKIMTALFCGVAVLFGIVSMPYLFEASCSTQYGYSNCNLAERGGTTILIALIAGFVQVVTLGIEARLEVGTSSYYSSSGKKLSKKAPLTKILAVILFVTGLMEAISGLILLLTGGNSGQGLFIFVFGVGVGLAAVMATVFVSREEVQD